MINMPFGIIKGTYCVKVLWYRDFDSGILGELRQKFPAFLFN